MAETLEFGIMAAIEFPFIWSAGGDGALARGGAAGWVVRGPHAKAAKGAKVKETGQLWSRGGFPLCALLSVRILFSREDFWVRLRGAKFFAANRARSY